MFPVTTTTPARVRLYQVNVGGARGVLMVFARSGREAIDDALREIHPQDAVPMSVWDVTAQWLELSSLSARSTWDILERGLTGCASFDPDEGWTLS